MDNTNTFDFNHKEDKHFFAGLFNTAINNFDLSLKELNKRMNHKKFKGNDKSYKIIDFAFNKDRPIIEFDNNFNYLSESLIFIKRLPSFIKNYNKNNHREIVLNHFLKDFLIDLYTVLENYRNFYTHYEHKTIKIENNMVFSFLDYILFNNVSRIKDDRVKTESVKAKLKAKYSDDFKTIIEKKNKWTEKKNIELIKNRKKTYDLFIIGSEKGNNYALNAIFRYFIDDSTKQPTLTNDVITKDNKNLTHTGFIQFLCLFLNKKQANILFDNVQYTKYIDDTNLHRIISRWVYTFESYKDIKHLFKSEYDEHSLLLQMVSELSKCPVNLYPHISNTKQQEFVEDINVYLKENTSIFNDDTLVSHEVIRKRYEDKFPYFAIRFLDEYANFPSLRFQINLGKFNHDTRQKTYKSTGKETERKILEKLVVFEQLNKAAKAKNEYFKKKNEIIIDKKAHNEIIENNDWVAHPRPKYQFNKNTIGIWVDIDNLGYYTDKELERKGNKPTKKDILAKLNLQDSYKKPVAYLSFNELPALLYSLLVEGKKGSDIENIIKGKIKQQRGVLANFDFNKDYTTAELKSKPKNIRFIYNNKNNAINWDKIERQLTNELKVNPLKEIRFNYKNQPKNPKVFSLSEKGKIATWLSKDIKRFSDKKTKEKWKGYQFAEFQALLSYYDNDAHRISKYIYEDLELKESKFAFEKGLNFGKKSLYDFYQNYLTERTIYINSLLENFYDTDHLKLIQAFTASRFVIKSPTEHTKNKLKDPIMLSRGIFDEKPTATKKESKETTTFAKWFEVSNKNNIAQEFYNYSKIYMLDNSVPNRIEVGKGIKQQYLSVSTKKEQKAIYNNEKLLRKTMRNDYYVLQMIKTFFANTTDVDTDSFNNITLRDFYLTKAERKTKATNQFNESYILSKRIKLSLLDGKIVDNVALKDSSKYKKLSQDKRVLQLIEFYPEKIWNFDEINIELDNFELVRSKKLFKQIHKLESTIYKKAVKNNEDSLLNNIYNDGKEVPNFKKYLTYHFLNNKTEKEQFKAYKKEISFNDLSAKLKKIVLLIEIRNKFSHNQYIAINSYMYLLANYPNKNNERIADYLNTTFAKILKDLQ
jgi:hypothetical protein